VKVGTNAICDEAGRLDRVTVRNLARQIGELMRQGRSVTLVASGAIGAGIGELDLPARPRRMPELQAVAAVGQSELMRAFHDALARHGVHVAQVLVTREDFEHRTRYLNIRNTLLTLGQFHALPIINENDAVATDEIRFGDNDIIAAHVANLVSADACVFLSTVDGVMDAGKALDVIENVDGGAMGLVTASRSRLGSGGMGSKMTAAGMVTRAGEVAVIANARTPNVLTRIFAGERVGTLFVPARRKLSSRRRWIGQAARPGGRVLIDAGAVRALAEQGKSLLASGVLAVDGKFAKGATVAILDRSGAEIARGLSNYSSDQIDRIKGLRTDRIAQILGDKPCDEVIHRNNMTLRKP
jgi:glutamate 5-kinase